MHSVWVNPVRMREMLCLMRMFIDELVEILRCYKTMMRLVVPVFYYIDPSVVQHQIGSFKEAFEKRQARLDVESEHMAHYTK